MKNEISRLIKSGGILFDVDGNTTDEIYQNVIDLIKLPDSFDSKGIYNALCAREKIMSTAVGNGIAIPHSRTPIIKNPDDQRIYIAYLKNPIDMKAPDGIKVHTLFFVLTQNTQDHRNVLSALATVFRDVSFRKLLEAKTNEEEILNAIQQIELSD